LLRSKIVFLEDYILSRKGAFFLLFLWITPFLLIQNYFTPPIFLTSVRFNEAGDMPFCPEAPLR
ncbi:MAG: hypothetical protein LBK57_10230, partial [Clostridiales Family XIII bacterium]|nr:hypothetical protein [Clostridiales Family XIII bacterium]